MYDVCTYILYYRYINAKEEEGDRLLYIAEVNINGVKTSRAYTFIYIYIRLGVIICLHRIEEIEHQRATGQNHIMKYVSEEETIKI